MENLHVKIRRKTGTVSIRGNTDGIRRLAEKFPGHVEVQTVGQSPLEAKAEVDWAAQLLTQMADRNALPELAKVARQLEKAAEAI